MLTQFSLDCTALFGRNYGPEGVVRDDSFSEHHRTGSYDRLLSDYSPVHHDCAHPNQGPTFDMRTVNDSLVANARIVFDDGFTLFERAMDDRSVLNVDSLSYVDGSNVSPDDGLKPTG